MPNDIEEYWDGLRPPPPPKPPPMAPQFSGFTEISMKVGSSVASLGDSTISVSVPSEMIRVWAPDDNSNTTVIPPDAEYHMLDTGTGTSASYPPDLRHPLARPDSFYQTIGDIIGGRQEAQGLAARVQNLEQAFQALGIRLTCEVLEGNYVDLILNANEVVEEHESTESRLLRFYL